MLKIVLLILLIAQNVFARSLNCCQSEMGTEMLKIQSRDLIDESAKLSSVVSAHLATPWVILAKGTHKIADSIPTALGIGDTVAGSLISAPIHFIANTVTGTTTSLTGFLVSVPISAGAGLVQTSMEMAKIVKNGGQVLVDLGKSLQVTPSSIENESDTEAPPSRIAAGIDELTKNLLLKPLAIILGAKGAITGYESMWLGNGLENIGNRIYHWGEGLAFTGKEIKGTGATIYQWGADGERIPIIASSDDLMAAFNVSKKLPPSILRYFLGEKADFIIGSADDEDEEDDEETTDSGEETSERKRNLEQPFVFKGVFYPEESLR